jgi:hypothetical protein
VRRIPWRIADRCSCSFSFFLKGTNHSRQKLESGKWLKDGMKVPLSRNTIFWPGLITDLKVFPNYLLGRKPSWPLAPIMWADSIATSTSFVVNSSDIRDMAVGVLGEVPSLLTLISFLRLNCWRSTVCRLPRSRDRVFNVISHGCDMHTGNHRKRIPALSGQIMCMRDV